MDCGEPHPLPGAGRGKMGIVVMLPSPHRGSGNKESDIFIILPSPHRGGAGGEVNPMPRNIVIGQPVAPEKVSRSKELRSRATRAEAVLWQALRANQLGGVHFRRQQIIGGWIVDFYCHQAGLVVEVDGSIHQTQAEQDAERDAVLREMGLRVIRFGNQQVLEDLPSVLRAIHGALALSKGEKP